MTTGTVEHLVDDIDWTIEADYRVVDWGQPHTIGGGPRDWQPSDAEAPTVDLTTAWMVYNGDRIAAVPLDKLPASIRAELERAAQREVEDLLEQPIGAEDVS